ncbi:hypothetical protein [Litorivivens sp.]
MLGRKLVLNDSVLLITGKTDSHWQARRISDQTDIDVEFQILAEALASGNAWWISGSEEEE